MTTRVFIVSIVATLSGIFLVDAGKAFADYPVSHSEERFDFEHYEKIKTTQAKEAQVFLNTKYPSGSNALSASRYVQAGGATCQFAEDHGYFYWCKYTRAGHGLMALVSVIEWQVVIYTDQNGSFVKRIVVGRGASGT